MIKTDSFSDLYIHDRYWDWLPKVKLNDSILFTCKKKSINGKIVSIGKDQVEVMANGKKYLVGMKNKKWEGQLI